MSTPNGVPVIGATPSSTPSVALGFDAIQAPDGTVFIKVVFSGNGIEGSFIVPYSHADQFQQQFNLQFSTVVAEVRKHLGQQNGKLIVPQSKIITPK